MPNTTNIGVLAKVRSVERSSWRR